MTRAKVSYTTDHKEILDGILLAITGVTAGKMFGFPAYFIGKKFVRLRLWRWRRGKIADRAGR